MSETATDQAIPAAQIEAVCELIRAAMECKTAHVFVNWSPHVEKVHVYAYPADTEYVIGGEREYLLNVDIRVGSEADHFDENPILRLHSMARWIRSL